MSLERIRSIDLGVETDRVLGFTVSRPALASISDQAERACEHSTLEMGPFHAKLRVGIASCSRDPHTRTQLVFSTVCCPQECQSARSVSAGSITDARRAGNQLAAMAAVVRITAGTPILMGSSTSTP